ncbi:MAG TPA: DUF6036 family nucleotidyltransferase [Bryobacteraceae bacterium]|nr:DUF6036 family nucleotidyltransferase [Bryobacteraceae bacterium]
MGGFAVIYHSQPRFTKGIDFFIKADPDTAQAVYAALAEFGAPLTGVGPEDFVDPNIFFRFGREPQGFDILPSIPGADFDATWKTRIEVVIDPISGLKANFISPEDLITSKLASGRPRDLAHVEDIRKAAESKRRFEKDHADSR